MGVKGLNDYLEHHCPEAAKEVNLVELIQRRNPSDEPPLIVVDGLSTINLYDDLDWIGGCQSKEFVEKAEQFVNAFSNIGVRLVFYFDGMIPPKKRETWAERRVRRVYLASHLLDEISEGVRSCDIDRSKHFMKPPGWLQFSRDVFQIICGCEVYQSIEECDDEMVEYAKRHNAFAILGQYTDLVILDKGEALYLSMDKLNLQTMTTIHYDSEALANSLDIHLSQLPVLAALLGNSVITAYELWYFHSKILGHDPHIEKKSGYKSLIPKLAEYISTLPTNEDRFLNQLPEISKTVFGHSAKANKILTSIQTYKSLPQKDNGGDNFESSSWREIMIEADQRHVKNIFPYMVYRIMNDSIFESENIIEDNRLHDLPGFARVTQPLRKRLYGILLKEKDLEAGKEHYIEEWCVAGPHSLDKPHYVMPEYPTVPHPGLIALWGNNESHSDARWNLFIGSVAPHLGIEQMRSIAPHMVFPTLILVYIYDYLEPWEVDAVLATAALIKDFDIQRLKELPSDPLLPRGVRLSNLFMQIAFLLNILLAACGYPISKKETLPLNFFDGKLFQSKYVAAKSGASHSELCENMANVEEQFQKARKLITGNKK